MVVVMVVRKGFVVSHAALVTGNRQGHEMALWMNVAVFTMHIVPVSWPC